MFLLKREVLQSHGTKDWIVSGDAGTVFVVLLLCVTNVVELACGREHRSSEPHGVALHVVRDDIDCQWNGLDLATADFLTSLDAVVDGSLDVTLESLSEILEHGGTSREHDVLEYE